MNGISPITGWTRSDWERLADRLLQDAPDAANRIIDRWVGGAARFAAA